MKYVVNFETTASKGRFEMYAHPDDFDFIIKTFGGLVLDHAQALRDGRCRVEILPGTAVTIISNPMVLQGEALAIVPEGLPPSKGRSAPSEGGAAMKYVVREVPPNANAIEASKQIEALVKRVMEARGSWAGERWTDEVKDAASLLVMLGLEVRDAPDHIIEIIASKGPFESYVHPNDYDFIIETFGGLALDLAHARRAAVVWLPVAGEAMHAIAAIPGNTISFSTPMEGFYRIDILPGTAMMIPPSRGRS